MYPDLSYLLHDLFGTEVDNPTSLVKTFGLLLAMAFIAAGYILRVELKRKEEEGIIKAIKIKNKVKEGINWSSIAINAFIGLILGLKIPYAAQNFSEVQQDPASVLFSMKGNWGLGILGAILMGWIYFRAEKKKETVPVPKEMLLYPHQKAADITIIAGISGVVGAKLFSILENLDAFFADPMGTILSGSGLTVYGGIILASIVVIWYIKKLGIPPLHLIDIGGMAILVGYAVGRMGCQFSGDGDWGIVAAAQPDWWFLPDWLWSYTYPNNVINSGALIEGLDVDKYNEYIGQRGLSIEERCDLSTGMRYCHELENGVYPTPVYETVLSLLGFLGLWLVRKRIKIAGVLFFLYMIFNGVERFFIEFLRVNDRYEFMGANWSQAQYISIAFVLVGISGIVFLVKRARSKQ